MSDTHAAIFCDFDGTISQADIGYELFKHFSGGRSLSLIPDWKAGRISNREILEREAEMVHATAEEILAFIDRYEIDSTFVEFERLCRGNDIPVTVVSEGMDMYIRRLLGRNGLDNVSVICNVGILENDGIRMEFPHRNAKCTRCGSCKGERIQEFRRTAKNGTVMIFVGDGYSDACAAKEADIVFAKKDLVRYCQAENIAYNAYDTFRDVTDWLVRQRYLIELHNSNRGKLS